MKSPIRLELFLSVSVVTEMSAPESLGNFGVESSTCDEEFGPVSNFPLFESSIFSRPRTHYGRETGRDREREEEREGE